MPRPEHIVYKDKVTGYPSYKDSFSEEELMKAFQIMDVNKDDLITTDDLCFILEYIRE